jgi:hypothetical protein
MRATNQASSSSAILYFDKYRARDSNSTQRRENRLSRGWQEHPLMSLCRLTFGGSW